MAIGRITGPLLKANLTRDGVDLAFETDLLYLDVVNARIGVNNNSPTTDLDVNGTIRATTGRIEDELVLGEITLSGNTITSSSNIINFQSDGGAIVYNSKLFNGDLTVENNLITTAGSGKNLEIEADGSGKIVLNSDTDINGNLYISQNLVVDGNVTIGGNIFIGDEETDTIVITAGIASNLLPDQDNNFDIGTNTFRWRNIFTENFYTNSLRIPTLDIGNIFFRDTTITTNTNLDLFLEGNGTGSVRLANFKFTGNVITNVVSGAITQIAQTGDGYFKIDTTNGFVPPVGTSGQRPTTYAVVGMMRYNSDTSAIEVWDGFSWASPAGSEGAINFVQAENIAVSLVLTLG